MTTTSRTNQLSSSAGPSSEDFRHVIGHFLSGVTVVTTTLDGTDFGTTASAVTSLCLEPPMVVLCLNRTSSTSQAVSMAGRFALNMLDEDGGPLATRFATKGSDKFDGVGTTRSSAGLPLLPSSLAWLEAEVTEAVTMGTHTVFMGRVLSAEARPGRPLAYFRGRFGRLAP
ncbi:MAG TPA: flavin reductase family protein [Streptomyces sp.]|uniref:flavin reductase family protein n=1 Tax=Streptomyces sp. TaxID=1931 RepID=UPI002BD44235|nr:flavin reductase family protein [Streptomyces sp.]HWU11836.1 flavin reductase family protein [Streptomyces sp.]